jgi:hypothetical protein
MHILAGRINPSHANFWCEQRGPQDTWFSYPKHPMNYHHEIPIVRYVSFVAGLFPTWSICW